MSRSRFVSRENGKELSLHKKEHTESKNQRKGLLCVMQSYSVNSTRGECIRVDIYSTCVSMRVCVFSPLVSCPPSALSFSLRRPAPSPLRDTGERPAPPTLLSCNRTNVTNFTPRLKTHPRRTAKPASDHR